MLVFQAKVTLVSTQIYAPDVIEFALLHRMIEGDIVIVNKIVSDQYFYISILYIMNNIPSVSPILIYPKLG